MTVRNAPMAPTCDAGRGCAVQSAFVEARYDRISLHQPARRSHRAELIVGPKAFAGYGDMLLFQISLYSIHLSPTFFHTAT